MQFLPSTPFSAPLNPQRRFTTAERAAFHELMRVRRDMRHFVPGASVPEDVLLRLQQALHAAPSVGLMQPLRVIRITQPHLRADLAACVEAERLHTAEQLGSRGAEFMALKVEGVRECAELWAVVLAPDDGTVFGRRTLPREMAWCSAGAAVQNLWLAARAEHLGLGWVSLFDPAAMVAALRLPDGAEPLGLLCIGPVESFYPAPMLVQTQWREQRSANAVFADDVWPEDDEPPAK